MKTAYKFFPAFLYALCLGLFWPGAAHAYIGPAIAFVGYLLGPVAAVIALVAMVLFWPAKALWKKYKKNKAADSSEKEELANKEPAKEDSSE